MDYVHGLKDYVHGNKRFNNISLNYQILKIMGLGKSIISISPKFNLDLPQKLKHGTQSFCGRRSARFSGPDGEF